MPNAEKSRRMSVWGGSTSAWLTTIDEGGGRRGEEIVFAGTLFYSFSNLTPPSPIPPPMPAGGKKRKAETSTTMWTSSSSSSPGNGSSRRGSNKNKGSRPGTSSDKMTSSTATTSTESKAEELWEEICDEDNPTTASMEGEVLYFLVVFVCVSTTFLCVITCILTIFNIATPDKSSLFTAFFLLTTHSTLRISVININIGICKLCEQLNLDPIEDVRVLVLLYKLGANKKPAEIQKEEWMAGCHALSLDGIDKFKKFVPQLDTGFMDREEFGDFYKVRKKIIP